MKKEMRQRLIDIAKKEIIKDDPSHDIFHTLRVLHLAETISKAEGGDLDVIIPAALFHDIITYPKHDAMSSKKQDESADKASDILSKIKEYPKEKIEAVKHCISSCSFTKQVKHEKKEAQILQDADGLESTGAISIMRTFCSTGQMNRRFYHPDDPMCRTREPDAKEQALDLVFARLLKVKDRMYTQTARDLAMRRAEFLQVFLLEINEELKESHENYNGF